MKLNIKNFGGKNNFIAILKRISQFAYPDDMRRNMNGIYFEFKFNETILTATDGYTLISESFVITSKEERSFTISLKGIESIIEEIANFSDKQTLLSIKKDFILSEFDRYPHYREVIPNIKRELITIDKAECLAKIQTLSTELKRLEELEAEAEKILQDVKSTIRTAINEEADKFLKVEEELSGLSIVYSYSNTGHFQDIVDELSFEIETKETEVFINDDQTYSFKKLTNSIVCLDFNYFNRMITSVDSEKITILHEGGLSPVMISNKNQTIIIKPRKF